MRPDRVARGYQQPDAKARAAYPARLKVPAAAQRTKLVRLKTKNRSLDAGQWLLARSVVRSAVQPKGVHRRQLPFGLWLSAGCHRDCPIGFEPVQDWHGWRGR